MGTERRFRSSLHPRRADIERPQPVEGAELAEAGVGDEGGVEAEAPEFLHVGQGADAAVADLGGREVQNLDGGGRRESRQVAVIDSTTGQVELQDAAGLESHGAACRPNPVGDTVLVAGGRGRVRARGGRRRQREESERR